MRKPYRKTLRKKRFATKRRSGKVSIPRSMPSSGRLPDVMKLKFTLEFESFYTSQQPTQYQWNPLWCPWYIVGATSGSMAPITNGSLSSTPYSTFAAGWLPFLFLYGKHQVKKASVRNSFCLTSDNEKLNVEFASAILPQYAAAEIFNKGSVGSQSSVEEIKTLSTYPGAHRVMLSNGGGGQNIYNDSKTVDIAQFMDQPLTSEYSINRNPQGDSYSTVFGNSLIREFTFPPQQAYQRMPAYCWAVKAVDANPSGQPLALNVRTLFEYEIEMSQVLPLPTSTIYCPGGVSAISTNSSTAFIFTQRTY